MKTRKQLTAFLLIIVLINIALTSIDLGDFELQLHDTYIVFDGSTAVFVTTLIVLAIVVLYLLVEFAVRQYRIIALIVAIVNPIAAVFMLMLINASIQTLRIVNAPYPENTSTGQIIFLCVFVGLFCLQVIVETKALKQVAELLRPRGK